MELLRLTSMAQILTVWEFPPAVAWNEYSMKQPPKLDLLGVFNTLESGPEQSKIIELRDFPRFIEKSLDYPM
jgi:hypothetical protein